MSQAKHIALLTYPKLQTNELLHQVAHRPSSLPSGKWKFYQEWNQALFLHWKVDTELLRFFIPKELELDLFEQQAWISLVAFDMNRVRPRNLPHFRPVSDFSEINLRTYVTQNGKSGVYFLSIEAGKRMAARVARKLSGLPYRYSAMTRTSGSFFSENPQSGDLFNLRFNPGKALATKTELDKWLTERYALFQDVKGSIRSFDIQHVEWPVHELQIHEATINYPRFRHLIDKPADVAHYSPGVQVLAW